MNLCKWDDDLTCAGMVIGRKWRPGIDVDQSGGQIEHFFRTHSAMQFFLKKVSMNFLNENGQRRGDDSIRFEWIKKVSATASAIQQKFNN